MEKKRSMDLDYNWITDLCTYGFKLEGNTNRWDVFRVVLILF